MIVIALPNKAKKTKHLFGNNFKWCYLGKDVAKREKVTNILGEERKFYLKDRLHKVVEGLSQSYIDFVARLGKEQKSQLNWWANKFASKRQMQTDFFLLLCYKALTIELLQQAVTDDRLIIFVEDPWLFFDIKKSCESRDIDFLGKADLSLNKFLCLIRGIMHRLLLVGWVLLARSLVYCIHKGKKPRVLETQNSAVGIINPAEPRAFRNGRYVNNYTPGLPEFYEINGVPFFYIYLLRFPLATAKCIGMNKEILWPIIIDAKLSSAIKRIFDYWRPLLKNDDLKRIAKYDVSGLLERERWLEFSSAGFNIHLILFDTLDRFFRKKWCRSLIYVFENQPWEKMLCMAAVKNNLKVIGYQHSFIWRLYLSQFIGKGEDSFVPLPHRIVTSGSYFADLYKEGGMPEDKIVLGGAWRYPHMINGAKREPLVKKDFNSKRVVLITLCFNIFISKSMLENVFKAMSENCLNKEMEFWVKPHPGNTRYELNKLNRLISKYQVVNRPFKMLLNDVDIVISSESISGLEAFLCGKKVISYIPENILAADPLLDITDERIYKWYEGEDISIDFLKDFSSIPNPETMEDIKARYFSRIDHDAWLELSAA